MCDIYAALPGLSHTLDMLMFVKIQMFGRQVIFKECRYPLVYA
jgi:hypothetical protein